ncbi:MAG: ABC transporter permease [Bacilli bacterium]|nr:ABC transporter permease [Bacilli bacterium]
MRKEDFEFVDSSLKQDKEQIRTSLTYWKDAWRRLKQNRLALVGLIAIILITLIAIFGPLFTAHTYREQDNDKINTTPALDIYQIDDGLFVYVSRQYRLFIVSEDGVLGDLLVNTETNVNLRYKTYEYNGEEITLDYSYKFSDDPEYKDIDFTFTYKDVETFEKHKTVLNKTYPFGTDQLGRDVMTRVFYGARISLTVALVATLVNLFIGVAYGAISGLEGGKVDNTMMRIVDIINSIPLLLYVILLMVMIDNRGLWTIIITLGSVYWVGMARLVRGQVLSLKNQEFVLAARMLGVSKGKTITKHLIPNALGPIIVSMTMMIPTAVFTESFLSFIGLGISAPTASWGTLANDALGGLELFPYQLFFPSLAIAITMLAFNFLGDGLRTALDPRLRKG